MNADARQTEFCTDLSAILLGGLLLNLVSDLWWADPAAALVMVPVIAIEGVDGLRGNTVAIEYNWQPLIKGTTSRVEALGRRVGTA